MAFVTGGENFIEREQGHGLAKLFEFGEGQRNFFSPPVGLGDEPRNRPAMPGDDDCFAALHLAQKLRQFALASED